MASVDPDLSVSCRVWFRPLTDVLRPREIAVKHPLCLRLYFSFLTVDAKPLYPSIGVNYHVDKSTTFGVTTE